MVHVAGVWSRVSAMFFTSRLDQLFGTNDSSKPVALPHASASEPTMQLLVPLAPVADRCLGEDTIECMWSSHVKADVLAGPIVDGGWSISIEWMSACNGSGLLWVILWLHAGWCLARPLLRACPTRRKISGEDGEMKTGQGAEAAAEIRTEVRAESIARLQCIIRRELPGLVEELLPPRLASTPQSSGSLSSRHSGHVTPRKTTPRRSRANSRHSRRAVLRPDTQSSSPIPHTQLNLRGCEDVTLTDWYKEGDQSDDSSDIATFSAKDALSSRRIGTVSIVQAGFGVPMLAMDFSDAEIESQRRSTICGTAAVMSAVDKLQSLSAAATRLEAAKSRPGRWARDSSSGDARKSLAPGRRFLLSSTKPGPTRSMAQLWENKARPSATLTR